MSSTPGQAILALIESDIASTAAAPVLALITALQASKGNILMQQAAILQFVASAPTFALQLELDVEEQLLTWVAAKVQAYMASKSAPK